VSGEQRNKFLPKPRSRTRAHPVSLWVAIVLTFTVFLTIGGILFLLVVVLLDYADAPGWLVLSTWPVPTVAMLVWALRARFPATASDYEAQSWGDYSVRAVMIGIERPRNVAARVATAVRPLDPRPTTTPEVSPVAAPRVRRVRPDDPPVASR
jgi:hypothetical protein